MLYTLKTVIGFGKHKGKTVRMVLDDDPQYLLWAYKNIEDFDLEQTTIRDAKEFAGDSRGDMSWGDLEF